MKGLIVSTFIDDIKGMGVKRSGYIKKVELELISALEMADMRPISFILGLKIETNRANKNIEAVTTSLY